MKRIFVGLFCVFLISNAYAACNNIRCSGKVKRLFVSEVAIYVEMDGDMSLLNCPLHSNTYATLRSSHPFRSEIYSMLLAAHSTNSNSALIRISEGSSGCKINYATSTK